MWTIYPINLFCGIIGYMLVSLIPIMDVWDQFCQTPTVSLHPQTNISLRIVLHNLLHFPIKDDLSELKLTNLFGGILCLMFDTIMDIWDKFWQANVKNHDAPFEVCHFKYIGFGLFFGINCLKITPSIADRGLLMSMTVLVSVRLKQLAGEYFEQQQLIQRLGIDLWSWLQQLDGMICLYTTPIILPMIFLGHWKELKYCMLCKWDHSFWYWISLTFLLSHNKIR